MSRFRSSVLGALLCSLAMVTGHSATADVDVFQIGSGDLGRIDRHGHCRMVENLNDHPLAVPVSAANEWHLGASSFLASERPGINVTACATPRRQLASGASIRRGTQHFCAIQDEAVYCWGSNNFNQLGNNVNDPSTPNRVSLPAQVRAAFASDERSCAITIADDLYCWGRSYGANPRLLLSNVSIVDMGTFADTTATTWQSCASTFGGEFYCWDSGGSPSLVPAMSGNAGTIRNIVAGWNVRWNNKVGSNTYTNPWINGYFALNTDGSLFNFAYPDLGLYSAAPSTWGDPRNTDTPNWPAGAVSDVASSELVSCLQLGARRVWCVGGIAALSPWRSNAIGTDDLQPGASITAFSTGPIPWGTNPSPPAAVCAAVRGDTRGNVLCAIPGNKIWHNNIPGDILDVAVGIPTGGSGSDQVSACAMNDQSGLYCFRADVPGSAAPVVIP